MEKSIFESAKFGDKFITEEGKIAIYHLYDSVDSSHILIIEDGTEGAYDDNGINYSLPRNPKQDIVSRYQEPIDEDKILDEIYEE